MTYVAEMDKRFTDKGQKLCLLNHLKRTEGLTLTAGIKLWQGWERYEHVVNDWEKALNRDFGMITEVRIFFSSIVPSIFTCSNLLCLFRGQEYNKLMDTLESLFGQEPADNLALHENVEAGKKALKAFQKLEGSSKCQKEMLEWNSRLNGAEGSRRLIAMELPDVCHFNFVS